MAAPQSGPRVVLDTNLVLSALIFTQGHVSRLRSLWQDGHCQPLLSRATSAELMRVLAYPKFKLQAADQQELFADYLPYCKVIDMPATLPATPPCRDPYDLPFLQLAIVGKAEYLVSGDHDLLQLQGHFLCPIVNASAFMEILVR